MIPAFLPSLFFFCLMIRRPPRSTRTDTLVPYTTLFRAQEARIKARIELVAVVQPIVGQMRELAGERRDQFQAIILIGRIMPLGTAVQPEMLEARRPVILAGQPEAVEITGRSEERRGGKAGVSTCRTRWAPRH